MRMTRELHALVDPDVPWEVGLHCAEVQTVELAQRGLFDGGRGALRMAAVGFILDHAYASKQACARALRALRKADKYGWQAGQRPVLRLWHGDAEWLLLQYALNSLSTRRIDGFGGQDGGIPSGVVIRVEFRARAVQWRYARCAA